MSCKVSDTPHGVRALRRLCFKMLAAKRWLFFVYYVIGDCIVCRAGRLRLLDGHGQHGETAGGL